ncbi:TPA: hypothetical protein SMN24_000184 [Proteus mirabilis]|nr:hypothetical protein [Proteus mirabilis]MBI6509719.1 hypothetical protein [Proteus mirabilis]HEJ9550467.1 hypothetical protein [Proteus mirabilis]
MKIKEPDELIADADKYELKVMFKSMRIAWLIFTIVLLNLIPMLIHGGVLSLSNFLIFNVFVICIMLWIYIRKIFYTYSKRNSH